MKKAILLILIFLLNLDAVETINYHGDIVNIKLSKDSWNRLIFDSEVNAEPIFSKEKNVDIYKANQSVFIKFKPMLKVEVSDKQEQVLDIDYSNSKKSELFISTANGTYSFTIEPVTTDAKTYSIQNIQNKNENLLKFEMDSNRKVFKEITKNIFINEEFDNYEKIRLSMESTIIDNLIVTPKYKFKGKIYSAYLFNVTANSDMSNIDERLFLSLNFNNKKAISIKDKNLSKNQMTQLIIILGN